MGPPNIVKPRLFRLSPFRPFRPAWKARWGIMKRPCCCPGCFMPAPPPPPVPHDSGPTLTTQVSLDLYYGYAVRPLRQPEHDVGVRLAADDFYARVRREALI